MVAGKHRYGLVAHSSTARGAPSHSSTFAPAMRQPRRTRSRGCRRASRSAANACGVWCPAVTTRHRPRVRLHAGRGGPTQGEVEGGLRPRQVAAPVRQHVVHVVRLVAAPLPAADHPAVRRRHVAAAAHRVARRHHLARPVPGLRLPRRHVRIHPQPRGAPSHYSTFAPAILVCPAPSWGCRRASRSASSCGVWCPAANTHHGPKRPFTHGGRGHHTP